MARQKRQRKAYTSEERQVQIIACLAIARQEGFAELTTADIASRLHMTASTHLRLLINDLVLDKQVIERRETDPGIAKFRRMYSLPTTTTLGKVAKIAEGYIGGRKETKNERDLRLARVINRSQGQIDMFAEANHA